MSVNIADIAKQIKLLILDVDGVLTNGKVYFTANGEEILRFDIHDGFGIKRLQKMGVAVAVISGRSNPAVSHRLNQLKIEHVFLGQLDKLPVYTALINQLQINDSEVAYLGDDLPDLPVMQKVALPIAVANAVAAIKHIAKITTSATGGHGAVREICDLIYEAQQA